MESERKYVERLAVEDFGTTHVGKVIDDDDDNGDNNDGDNDDYDNDNHDDNDYDADDNYTTMIISQNLYIPHK